MLKILYIGPWASDQALFARKATNQAATQWARGLINGLLENGAEVRVCTHCREQVWPLGELRPGRREDFHEACGLRFSSYWNVPLARDAFLSGVYRKMIRDEVTECRPDIFLLYNMEPYHCAASDVLTALQVPWIPIILDENEVGEKGWERFTARVRDAAGLIFLSYWGFAHCPLTLPKLHLDGGVAPGRMQQGIGVQGQPRKTVVYSGVYDEGYGGLQKLFEIFSAVRNQACRFLLTGKDAQGNLKKYLKRDPRVEYLGFLSRDALMRVHAEASVFINPRPRQDSANRMTFPSKLLDYLAYGKPTVSTWTEGLAPDYRNLLLVPEQDTPEAYAALIDEALSESPDSRLKRENSIADWVSTHTWEDQAKRLIQWITQNDIGRTRH